MEPSWPFSHLPMPDRWPLSDTAITCHTPKLTSAGRQQDGITLTLHGILQLCVLQMPPFQDCADDAVCDVRDIHPRGRFTCRNRPLLLQTLADALMDYEESAQDITKQILDRAAARQQALSVIDDSLTTMGFFFGHTKTLEKDRAAKKRLERMTQRVSNMERQIHGRDYLQFRQFELLKNLHQAFWLRGPGSEYRKIALAGALATILKGFSLRESQGSVDTDAKKMRSRLDYHGLGKKRT